MLFAIVLLLTIGCIAFILVREAKADPRPDGCGGASGQPRRDLRRPGPAADPGHGSGHAAARAGQLVRLPGGRRARRGRHGPDLARGRAGADLQVAGLGRHAGRGGPAGPRRLRVGDRGVLARGARVRVRLLRPAQQPDARPALGRRPGRLHPAGRGPVAGAAGDAPSPGRLARPRARGPGPAADPAGADADPDPQRRAWTPQPPNCAGSSATCTTARRPGWSRSA